jgi:hypothetical protein
MVPGPCLLDRASRTVLPGSYFQDRASWIRPQHLSFVCVLCCLLVLGLFSYLGWEHNSDANYHKPSARLAQSVERKALNLVVVGSSPTVGVFPRPASWPTGHHTARTRGRREKAQASTVQGARPRGTVRQPWSRRHRPEGTVQEVSSDSDGTVPEGSVQEVQSGRSAPSAQRGTRRRGPRGTVKYPPGGTSLCCPGGRIRAVGARRCGSRCESNWCRPGGTVDEVQSRGYRRGCTFKEVPSRGPGGAVQEVRSREHGPDSTFKEAGPGGTV